MSAHEVGGAQGGQSFLGTLQTLALGGLGVYGQIRAADAKAEQDRATAELGARVAQSEVARSDSRYKWIALAGLGLILSVILIKKGKLAA